MTLAKALVVPCFNEEQRLREGEIRAVVEGDPALHVILVDDGSDNGTLTVLERVQRALGAGRVTLLRSERNAGKGEAVRKGLREGLARGAGIVGYADADFATPAREVLELLAHLEQGPHQAVLGSRVMLLGSRIQRSVHRHVLGRVFATLASLAIDARVYDTQCGAKWFRASPALAAALEAPFGSRWIFDVELLGRLLGRFGAGPRLDVTEIVERPVRTWSDVSGSKLGVAGMLRSLVDLARLWARALAARGARSAGAGS